ncbi:MULTISPECIES: hypothetical protein [unclassified Bradyrhizobium]|uniref:hypothetical protein n=1 Tax=unclassified Bradyrhizobium TaxID=2631580 RepID=UPI0015CB75A0|nr:MULTISPECIES: hypothetical protein [unclassified Bradyrhizobium]MBB4258981.1 hypothetical protein [Bradyrhizobium sp. CIR3A]NYG48693.1 hypothetical protein [Bradyrhizobium sp. IAR9]
MPILRLIANTNFTPKQQPILQLAFNHALRKLGLIDRNDPVCELVARRMIELHKRGVTSAPN